MGISDWSADVCASDLEVDRSEDHFAALLQAGNHRIGQRNLGRALVGQADGIVELLALAAVDLHGDARRDQACGRNRDLQDLAVRSEGHTSELQSLMRLSYAVFCLKKKKQKNEY